IQVKLVRAMEDQKKCDFELIRKLNKLNFAVYLTVIIGALGLVVAGNFRINEWTYMHAAGAAFAFYSLYICIWLMVCIEECFAVAVVYTTHLFRCAFPVVWLDLEWNRSQCR